MQYPFQDLCTLSLLVDIIDITIQMIKEGLEWEKSYGFLFQFFFCYVR